jgi:hypothetical protein
MPGKVLITAVPPGEAPDWVRQAWVGLELPFYNPTSGGYVGGVLTRVPTNRKGFCVETETALDILEKKDPKAAAWWRENVSLALLDALVFDSRVCQVLD